MSSRRINLVLAIFLFLVVVCPSTAQAFTIAFADAGSTTVWASSTTGTVTVSAAAGDRICVGSDVQQSNRTITITDNRSGGSHTYTRVANREIAGTVEFNLDCVVADSAVTQITGTISSTLAGNTHLYAWVVSGGSSSIGTPNAVTAETSPAGVNHNPGTLTISGASSLLLGASVHTGTSTFSLDGSFFSRYSQVGVVVGDKEVTANDDMANTTAGNRVSISYLYEVPAAVSADGPGGVTTTGAGK